jgi:hypothetical protein
MCCFSQPVQRVANTRIFARRFNRDRQYLAYQMAVQTVRPTAMILPLPVSLPMKPDAVRFISLKEYPAFFEALSTLFVRPMTAHASSREEVIVLSRPLPVQNVGDFVASFVPRLQDFSRLDPRFVIKPAVWRKLPRYGDYGFAVFQLKAPARTLAQVHPMALEFRTRLREQIFFPTVHIHDGALHAREEFDHELYWQGRGEEMWPDRMSRLRLWQNVAATVSPVPTPKAYTEFIEVASRQNAVPTPTPAPVKGPDGKPLPHPASLSSSRHGGVEVKRAKGLYVAGDSTYRWTIRGLHANEDILV